MKNRKQYVQKTTEVRKKTNPEIRFWKKVVKRKSGCWEWTASIRTDVGYGQFSFNGYPEYTHRMSWFFTYGNIPKNKRVLHKCDNKKCVRPTHLFIGTQKDNVHDMMNKNRDSFIGERNPSSKLTEVQVKKIRKLRNILSKQEIAKKFKVSEWTINDIFYRRTWAWL